MGCVGNLSTLFSLVPFHIEMHVQLHLIQWHHKGKYNTAIMFVYTSVNCFCQNPPRQLLIHTVQAGILIEGIHLIALVFTHVVHMCVCYRECSGH